MNTQRRKISLDKSIVDQVESFIEETHQFRSIAAFFEDAAKKRLQELEKVAS